MARILPVVGERMRVAGVREGQVGRTALEETRTVMSEGRLERSTEVVVSCCEVEGDGFEVIE